MKLQTLITVLCCLILCSCSKVEPWDKENFSKPSMSLKPWSSPDYAVQKTMYKALSPSRGGTGLGGGGCGCG